MNRIEKREKKLFTEATQAIKLEKTAEKKPVKNLTIQAVTTRLGEDGQLYVMDEESGDYMTVENFGLRRDIEKKLKKG